MSLITKAQFEQRLAAHLNEIDPGLSYRAKRRIGFAWDPIIDHMYTKHAVSITFANIAEVMAARSQAIVQLIGKVKDE